MLMITASVRALPRAVFAAGLALAVFAAPAMPAHAAAARGAYAVTLNTPLAKDRREIIEGAIWRCAGDSCSAPADGAQPQALCGKVMRKFGSVASFATPQGSLSAEQLARCNSAS
jgi:hypothetical protein